MATLTLTGVRSIQDAEIDLSGPITLLAGGNGEGKSSVLLALKAILTGTTACISSKNKYDADGMCADGMSKRASAMLSEGDEKAVAAWSKTKCYPLSGSKSTAGLPRASKAAADDFLGLPAKERADIFLDVFQIDLTQDDLVKGLTNAQLDVSAEEIWKDITVHGWDGVYKQTGEGITELKGEWKGTTGETWSEDRAEEWSPDCMSETSMPKSKLDALARLAVNAAEKAAQVRAEFDAIEIPPEPGHELTCPHCSKAVTMRGRELIKHEQVNEAERERLIKSKRAMEGRVVGLADDARKAEAELNAATALAARSEEARDERIAKAAAVHQKIKTQLSLATVLGPDGIRATKRENLLHLLNGQLSDMSKIIGIDEITLVWGPEPGQGTPTINANMGKRLYQNISRSEQWRVRLVVQLLIASRDGSNIVLLDDCEILIRQYRGPLIKLLSSTGIKVVAAMSISDGPGSAPDLARANFGQTYWIENGTAVPLAAAQEAIAKAA